MERRAVLMAAQCRTRPAIAHRDPTAYCWRLVSGLWSSPSSGLELTRRLPRPLFRARWLIAEFNTPLPLRGQRRTSPASQILLLNDEQAPSATPWYLILSCAINLCDFANRLSVAALQ